MCITVLAKPQCFTDNSWVMSHLRSGFRYQALCTKAIFAVLDYGQGTR